MPTYTGVYSRRNSLTNATLAIYGETETITGVVSANVSRVTLADVAIVPQLQLLCFVQFTVTVLNDEPAVFRHTQFLE